jgi:tryptophanyl-tRNA synthetase
MMSQNTQNKPQRVLTGITTSGIPHLGNLAGAILPAINASKNPNVSSFLFLADYHSLIKNLDPELTHTSSFEIAACWLACGLDPKKVTFYRQSDVPYIFELTWILNCLTSKGLMNRAHAYKAAVVDNENTSDPDKGIGMGLFNYPILMAADILMFEADIVPVGQDQKQHIEMTRDIALRFNHYYGDILTIPEAMIDDRKGTIPGIDGRKMSKSYKNTIPIFESQKKLRKTIMKIKTNSLEPGQPKDSDNCSVFKIFQAFADEDQIKDLKKKYEDGIAWGDAKELLFNLIDNRISGFRKEYEKIIQDREYLEKTLNDGSEKAKEISTPMIKKIRNAVGIKAFN